MTGNTSPILMGYQSRIVPWAICLGLLLASLGGFGASPEIIKDSGAGSQPPAIVHNLAQVRQLSTVLGETNLMVDLTGVVGGIFPELSLVVLRDDTGNAGIKMDLQRFPFLKKQQLIRIEGQGHFGNGEASLLPLEIIDNDGAHNAQEVTGHLYLTKGLHPLCLSYFQAVRQQALLVEYEGPDTILMPLPEAKLFHVANPTEAEPHYEQGLDCDYYEGFWDGVPDFRQLEPVKSGITRNISLETRQRDEYYALSFTGLLEIQKSGTYVFHVTSDDGSRLFVQETPTSVKILSENQGIQSDPPKQLHPGQAFPLSDDYSWGVCEGKLGFVGSTGKGWNLEINSDGNQIKVLLNNAASLPPGMVNNCLIRATGFCKAVLAEHDQRIPGVIMVSSTNDLSLLKAKPDAKDFQAGTTIMLPLLTSAEQIRQLKPEEAARAYPVVLRGIITARETLPEGIIQDLTSAVYVQFDFPKGRQISAGNYCELTGVTAPGGYATMVIASQVAILGPGQFPTPLHPDFAQMLGGSMDCQWVELQGMLSHFDGSLREAQLVVKGGTVRTFFLINSDLNFMATLPGAFVRIRGCVVPARSASGNPAREACLWVPSVSCIAMDQPPPAAPFNVPLQQISEFSKFDPNPNYYQTTKVRGQILHLADKLVYFTDGKDVMRILPKNLPKLAVGDLVEAVGLPEVGFPTPTLIEASLRKVGQTNLLSPPLVDFEQVLQAKYDAHRVRIEGRLIEIRTTVNQMELFLQSGLRNLRAVASAHFQESDIPLIGSRIALCGVVAQSQSAKSENMGTTELLFNSPSDLTTLESPPFWTQKRTLWAFEVLLSTVSLAGLWIYFLRRTVFHRTRALKMEMHERQSAEEKVQRLQTQRALEEQRARIARNIHDDLGARATKLSLLAHRHPVSAEDFQTHLDQISSTSRQIVAALDETVWAVNPVNDSLLRLANYVMHFAQDFFQNTGMHCRLDIPTDLPEISLTAEFRYNLFLMVKEALNNALKHSGAHTVLLQMQTTSGRLQLNIQDDGRGFNPDSVARKSGLHNLQARVTGLGGHIHIKSAPDQGTQISITIPLLHSAVKPSA